MKRLRWTSHIPVDSHVNSSPAWSGSVYVTLLSSINTFEEHESREKNEFRYCRLHGRGISILISFRKSHANKELSANFLYLY